MCDSSQSSICYRSLPYNTYAFLYHVFLRSFDLEGRGLKDVGRFFNDQNLCKLLLDVDMVLRMTAILMVQVLRYDSLDCCDLPDSISEPHC